MTNAGKAQYVEKEDAIRTLEKYPKNPLIVRKMLTFFYPTKILDFCRFSKSFK